ncbi:hypothetical protein FQZ97_1182790 [compost metagenome]
MPGLAGIEGVGRADDEDRHFPEVRDILQPQVRKLHVVAVTEGNRPVALLHLQAIEDATPNVSGTLEGVPVAEYRHGMFTRLELLHQPAVLLFAKQIAANRRRIDQGVIELGE